MVKICEAARQYAQQQYGYLAKKVLSSWGIHATADFGEIVFNMIDMGQMRKTSDAVAKIFMMCIAFRRLVRDIVFALPDSL